MSKSYKFSLILFIILCLNSKLFADQTCTGDEFMSKCNACTDNNYFTSRTFMMTRPVSQNTAANQSLWHDFLYSTHDNGGSFEVITFYQKSIKNQRIAKYFTFNNKNLLRVVGDDNSDSACRDIRAEWLNLPANFKGSFSLNPMQKQFAAVLVYNQDLKSFVNYELVKRFWLEFSAPLVFVENSLNLCQYDVVNESATYPRDIKEAMSNSDWMSARIGGKKSVFGVAPLKFRFGGNFMDQDNDQIIAYASLVIPTGKQDNDQYLFEPLSDYNGHWGLAFGNNFQIVLNRKNTENLDICLYLNFDALFLIQTKHCRTFDLKTQTTVCNSGQCGTDPSSHCAPCDFKKKPWSRYLLFNEKNGPPNQNIAGVNILTKDVTVRPYGIYDFSCGFRLIKLDTLELDLGFGIWGHGSEKIQCVRKFDKEWGIAGAAQPGDTIARSASLSTISCQKATDIENLATDFVFIPICVTDLDLDSGAAQGTLNYISTLAGGFEHVGNKVDVFIGGGIYYEWPQKNSALENLGGWLKLGGSF